MAAAPDRPPTPARPALRLAAATRPRDALGLRLAGVRVREVPSGEEGRAFRELLADAAIGVLAVESELLAAVPPHLVRRAARRGLPVVLPFSLPRRHGEARGREYAAALVRRAIGYHIRLGPEARP